MSSLHTIKLDNNETHNLMLNVGGITKLKKAGIDLMGLITKIGLRQSTDEKLSKHGEEAEVEFHILMGDKLRFCQLLAPLLDRQVDYLFDHMDNQLHMDNAQAFSNALTAFYGVKKKEQDRPFPTRT